MSFGGGTTSDIGDPRTGEATYAGTMGTAGAAERMGVSPQVLADIIYDSGDDGGDSGSDLSTQAGRQAAQQRIDAAIRAQAGADQVTAGYGAGQPAIQQLYKRIYNQPLPEINLGMVGLNKIGSTLAQGILNRVAEGGTPVYDPTGQIVGVMGKNPLMQKMGYNVDSYYGRSGFDPKAGGSQYDPETGVYRSRSVGGDIPMDDGDDNYIAPEATMVAAAQPEPEKSMIEQGYRYPVGGYYPEEGRFLRQGLLDVAPTTYGGLLAGYDPTQFGAMNVGFRQPTDVSLYEDPYDVSGYALI